MKTMKSAELGELAFEYNAREGTLKVGKNSYQSDARFVVLDGRKVPFWVHRADPTVWVWLDGEVYTFHIDDPRQRATGAAGGAAAGGVVKAQMPGKILQVSVKAGDRVQAGDNLLLMESMKMELTMDAPVAGTVAKVEVSAEQMVAQGDLLVEIEEE